MRCRLLLLVLLGLFATAPGSLAAPAAGSAGTASAGPPDAVMSSADAQQLIDTLSDPARRAALIKTLENLRNVAQTGALPTPAIKPAPPSMKGSCAASFSFGIMRPMTTLSRWALF